MEGCLLASTGAMGGRRLSAPAESCRLGGKRFSITVVTFVDLIPVRG